MCFVFILDTPYKFPAYIIALTFFFFNRKWDPINMHTVYDLLQISLYHWIFQVRFGFKIRVLKNYTNFKGHQFSSFFSWFWTSSIIQEFWQTRKTNYYNKSTCTFTQISLNLYNIWTFTCRYIYIACSLPCLNSISSQWSCSFLTWKPLFLFFFQASIQNCFFPLISYFSLVIIWVHSDSLKGKCKKKKEIQCTINARQFHFVSLYLPASHSVIWKFLS